MDRVYTGFDRLRELDTTNMDKRDVVEDWTNPFSFLIDDIWVDTSQGCQFESLEVNEWFKGLEEAACAPLNWERV